MTLKERVEQLLTQEHVEAALRDSTLRPGTAGRGHIDGYTVGQTIEDVVIVRCTFGAVSWPSQRRENVLLGVCSRILSDAGLLVEPVQDHSGGHLVVKEDPTERGSDWLRSF